MTTPRRIALFTCFAPNIGGGGVNLRSLCDGFSSAVEIHWFHLGPQTVDRKRTYSLGPPLSRGAPAADLVRTFWWWHGGADATFARWSRQIRALNPDLHWILAMNEGIPLGLQLLRDTPHVPLHVSIQDDQEHAVYGRSPRYRILARFTRRPTTRLLRSARSLDFTSDGMQNYYRERLGVDGAVVHPVISPPDFANAAKLNRGKKEPLRIGHIGTIYRQAELRQLIAAARLVGQHTGVTPELHFVGLAARFHSLLQKSGLRCQLHPACPEEQALRHLSVCHLVYAMYPFDAASAVFRQTSLPTKLTTYLKLGRPILVHSPADSSLATTVENFGLGVTCAAHSPAALAEAIEKAARYPAPYRQCEDVARRWYGRQNVDKLEALLTAPSPDPQP